ncbi:hypothetical protein HMN09_01139000 [Mycena chlorophos]|uniref:Uncharacterized protein n=1 Tax=Mycena chlorophos TaxID=658473 RepID=A0A8H6VXS4_MYCCL|nr:hypothetical protein HMN09_01139000 [Mycena chlorophos]
MPTHPLISAQREHDISKRLRLALPPGPGRAKLLHHFCLATLHDPNLVLNLELFNSGPGPRNTKVAQQESKRLCERCGDDGRPARDHGQPERWSTNLCRECMDITVIWVEGREDRYHWEEAAEEEAT